MYLGKCFSYQCVLWLKLVKEVLPVNSAALTVQLQFSQHVSVLFVWQAGTKVVEQLTKFQSLDHPCPAAVKGQECLEHRKSGRKVISWKRKWWQRKKNCVVVSFTLYRLDAEAVTSSRILARAMRGLRLSKDSIWRTASGDAGGHSNFVSAFCSNADRKSM